jgi:hypothetical protein
MGVRPAVALGCLLVCFPSPAMGASDDRLAIPVHLAVVVSDDCPGREVFVDRLKARSARIREARADEPAPSMQVELRAEEGQVVGELAFYPIEGPLHGQELRRHVRGADCESVATSLALVAAVILDPGATESAGPPAVPPPTLAPMRSPRSNRLSLGAALETAMGLGPDPAVVPRAFVDFELPAPLGAASLRLSFGRSYAQTIDTVAGSAEITFTDARLEPCLDIWSPASWRIRGCGIVEGGMLSGAGTRTKNPLSENRSLVELGLGLRPTWIVRDSFSLGLLAGASAPVARYRFYFASPDTTAYRVAAWSALVELSMAVRF